MFKPKLIAFNLNESVKDGLPGISALQRQVETAQVEDIPDVVDALRLYGLPLTRQFLDDLLSRGETSRVVKLLRQVSQEQRELAIALARRAAEFDPGPVLLQGENETILANIMDHPTGIQAVALREVDARRRAEIINRMTDQTLDEDGDKDKLVEVLVKMGSDAFAVAAETIHYRASTALCGFFAEKEEWDFLAGVLSNKAFPSEGGSAALSEFGTTILNSDIPLNVFPLMTDFEIAQFALKCPSSPLRHFSNEALIARAPDVFSMLAALGQSAAKSVVYQLQAMEIAQAVRVIENMDPDARTVIFSIQVETRYPVADGYADGPRYLVEKEDLMAALPPDIVAAISRDATQIFLSAR